jgi:creatinine amidohydrolase
VTYVELQHLTWPEAEQLGADGAIGLVTLASLEQHGPHLPLATDSLLAERAARDIAERLSEQVVSVPVVRGGLSTHHLAFPGSVSIPPDAYRGLVTSYVKGLERMGIRKVGLWSWHGGNFTFVREFVDEYEGEARVAGYSNLARMLELMISAGATAGVDAPETDVHAGGLETSTMLAAHPDLVRPFEGVKGYTAAEPDWLQRLFVEGIRPISESGVLGDLTGANAEAGRAILSAVADEMAGFFRAELDLAA